MPSINEMKLAEKLKGKYGVTFDVDISDTSKGLSVAARPSSDGRNMFCIEGVFSTKTRLQITAHPEGFSRPLFETMAHADVAMRQRCARHIDELYDNDRTMSFRLLVNNDDLRSMPVNDWPRSWDDFEYGFTVFPLLDHESKADLLEEGYQWIISAFRPLFDLLEVTIEYEGYSEGDAKKVLSTRYERDSRNRELCIEAKGARCAICGFDFGAVYGPIGEGFIHVHHIVPVSKLGAGYVIDPVRDLIPVCPNCHAMLHRFTPPMQPDELRDMLRGEGGAHS